MKADTSKFEQIYRDESDAIFRFCLIRVSNREQALDITQETFLRLWQSMKNKEEIRNTRAYLFTIAHRLIVDWYRKKKSISLESLQKNNDENDYDQVYDVPDEKTLDAENLGAEARYVLDKLDEISMGSRQPVYLRFVEGLSPGEIAEILGISANAASVRINRGLEELRKKTGYDKEI